MQNSSSTSISSFHDTFAHGMIFSIGAAVTLFIGLYSLFAVCEELGNYFFNKRSQYFPATNPTQDTKPREITYPNTICNGLHRPVAQQATKSFDVEGTYGGDTDLKMMNLWVFALRWFVNHVTQNPSEAYIAGRLVVKTSNAKNMIMSKLSLKEKCVLVSAAHEYIKILPKLANEKIIHMKRKNYLGCDTSSYINKIRLECIEGINMLQNAIAASYASPTTSNFVKPNPISNADAMTSCYSGSNAMPRQIPFHYIPMVERFSEYIDHDYYAKKNMDILLKPLPSSNLNNMFSDINRQNQKFVVSPFDKSINLYPGGADALISNLHMNRHSSRHLPVGNANSSPNKDIVVMIAKSDDIGKDFKYHHSSGTPIPTSIVIGDALNDKYQSEVDKILAHLGLDKSSVSPDMQNINTLQSIKNLFSFPGNPTSIVVGAAPSDKDHKNQSEVDKILARLKLDKSSDPKDLQNDNTLQGIKDLSSVLFRPSPHTLPSFVPVSNPNANNKSVFGENKLNAEDIRTISNVSNTCTTPSPSPTAQDEKKMDNNIHRDYNKLTKELTKTLNKQVEDALWTTILSSLSNKGIDGFTGIDGPQGSTGKKHSVNVTEKKSSNSFPHPITTADIVTKINDACPSVGVNKQPNLSKLEVTKQSDFVNFIKVLQEALNEQNNIPCADPQSITTSTTTLPAPSSVSIPSKSCSSEANTSVPLSDAASSSNFPVPSFTVEDGNSSSNEDEDDEEDEDEDQQKEENANQDSDCHSPHDSDYW